MAEHSTIEWTDASWTPIRARYFEIQNDGSGEERIGWRCEHASEGCRNCYAERMNVFVGTGREFKPGELYREERKGYHNGEVKLFLDDKMLLAPLRWKKPRMVFVCSMTDLFADFVPDDMIDKIFAVMALAPQHTFQVLTKRPERMRDYIASARNRIAWQPTIDVLDKWHPGWKEERADGPYRGRGIKAAATWPLPNVWLGVSAERQEEADERIPLLLQTPAAIRFASLEPLLGPIALTELCNGHWFCNALTGDRWHDADYGAQDRIGRLNQVIVGGESGSRARPMHPDWGRSLRDQCVNAGVPFFFKQWGEWQNGSDFAHDDSVRAVLTDGRVLVPDNYNLRVADRAERVMPHNPTLMRRVGKKAAGRLLDGREWNEMPEAK